jgi:plasmid maintenance system killer protein
MTPLQKQSYNLWFNHIGNLIMQWSKEKPANTDLKNMVQGMTEIGQYVNGLSVENTVLTKRIGLIREEKNKQLIMFKKQIEKLENDLKQYDI